MEFFQKKKRWHCLFNQILLLKVWGATMILFVEWMLVAGWFWSPGWAPPSSRTSTMLQVRKINCKKLKGRNVKTDARLLFFSKYSVTCFVLQTNPFVLFTYLHEKWVFSSFFHLEAENIDFAKVLKTKKIFFFLVTLGICHPERGWHTRKVSLELGTRHCLSLRQRQCQNMLRNAKPTKMLSYPWFKRNGAKSRQMSHVPIVYQQLIIHCKSICLGGNCKDEYTAAQYVPHDFYRVRDVYMFWRRRRRK